jgi:hypothetical protein
MGHHVPHRAEPHPLTAAHDLSPPQRTGAAAADHHAPTSDPPKWHSLNAIHQPGSFNLQQPAPNNGGQALVTDNNRWIEA